VASGFSRTGSVVASGFSRTVRTIAITSICALSPALLSAQPQTPARFSVDSAIQVDEMQGQTTLDRPNIVIDVTASMRLAAGWTLYVRPWFRQPRTSSWDRQIYQAAVQYERAGRVSTRVDAGYIVSPVGLGMMDTRPGVNPTILPHLSYVTPMPAFDPGAPRVQPIASTYPLGAQVTASGLTWDARGGILSAPTNRIYVLNSTTPNPKARPFFVAGGGLTPRVGLRLGVSYGAGEYVTRDELTVPANDGRSLRMVSLEGDYAFGYSRFTGEITRDRLETAASPATAYTWFIQGTQTLAPRWFVAGRQEGTSAPPLRTATTIGLRTFFHVTEATLGYRLTPELAVRGSFITRKAFTRADWDQQAGVSLVWARRWY
jgi:hypothetical protein